ncbi:MULTISPECIES: hypothetical protein [unclassified Shinella]|uniref:hypothetical protein n=1 Tax=unclassified Shinella TaxID=2643062 RepID=UPI00225CAE15|nr:hypothetical protein [Shinella sp. YE25]CAI0341201.1 NAD(P)-bd_dom domain-containing protein [Rhizobiaceae bacterium]CAK7260842.1 NAD(P)-binding domain-containing protein [Shinella sp. WSC3-e]
MARSSTILIVGGYGHVGRRIAADLHGLGHRSIRLAGRDFSKAAIAASELRCEAAHIDLSCSETWDAAVADIGTVIVCVDQQAVDFPKFVLERGLIYVDVTASDSFFRDVEQLNLLALERGGSAILSVGLAPGLTNLLVKACAVQMDQPETARIGVVLGVGDMHGPVALDWTFAQVALPEAQSAPFVDIAFGTPRRNAPALPLEFADQHVVRRTLGLNGATTLLAFDPPWQSGPILRMMRFVAVRPRLRGIAKRLMRLVHLGSDRVSLVVEVHGRHRGEPVTLELLLMGRCEADITAYVAALLVDQLGKIALAPGVHHIEQVISIEHIVQALEQRDIAVKVPTSVAHLGPPSSNGGSVRKI